MEYLGKVHRERPDEVNLCFVFLGISWEPKDFSGQELTMDSGVTGDLGFRQWGSSGLGFFCSSLD